MIILHFKCSQHFKLNIVMFVIFCNKIIIVPTKSSGVHLQATYSGVSLVNVSAALNDLENQLLITHS